VLVPRGWIRPRALAATLFLGFVALAIQAPFTYEHLTARPETYRHRYTLFREGGRLIAAHPLLGVGANNSTVARIRHAEANPAPPPTGGEVASFDNLYPIHNQFIVVTAETGLVGAALLAAFFLAVAGQALRRSASPDGLVAALAAAMLAGIVALGAQLTGDHLAANAARSMLWIDVAIVLALASAEQRRA
jgi:O-antigen ligase